MSNKSRKSNGVVLWRGVSAFDGMTPIMVIATGIRGKSRNGKTGAMVQCWILPEVENPFSAITHGGDACICGTCEHRGIIVDGRNVKRTCYVDVPKAPLNIWRTFHRGRYPTVTPDQAAELFRGRKVRLGAYGDPAAVPYAIWEAILRYVAAHTGYTHAWESCDPRFARICMASVDTVRQYMRAKARGYRTFRPKFEHEAREPREMVCGASKEMGHRTSCDLCVACGGTSSKARVDIVIDVHGISPIVKAYALTRQRIEARENA